MLRKYIRDAKKWSGGQTAKTTTAPAVLKIDDTSKNLVIFRYIKTAPMITSLAQSLQSLQSLPHYGENSYLWEPSGAEGIFDPENGLTNFTLKCANGKEQGGFAFIGQNEIFDDIFCENIFLLGCDQFLIQRLLTHDGGQPSSLSYFSYICFSVFIILICVIHGIFLVPQCRTVEPTNQVMGGTLGNLSQGDILKLKTSKIKICTTKNILETFERSLGHICTTERIYKGNLRNIYTI